MGKAKNLKIRVRSYFQPPVKLGPKTAALVSQITSIDYIEVNSETEALLLESRLIKKWQPPYNISSRDDKSPYFIHITRERFPKPVVNHLLKGAIAGPFLSSFITKKILRDFRKIVPYCTAKRGGRPCLYSHLGLCQPCPNDPQTQPSQYLQNITRLKSLLGGRFKSVQAQLKTAMKQASKHHNFELAGRLRDQLHQLDYLLQQPILPEEYIANPNLVMDRQHEAVQALEQALGLSLLQRIEMYDVANLAGTAATAAMTVAISGEINSKNFRHFTIRTKNTPDDVAMLAEVLTRRLKRQDWPRPDLIVLDGGKSQLSIVNSQPALPAGGLSIPVIALAKKNEVIYTAGGQEIELDRRHPGLQLLQRLRDEAHRFSRRLHHKHRKLL